MCSSLLSYKIPRLQYSSYISYYILIFLISIEKLEVHNTMMMQNRIFNILIIVISSLVEEIYSDFISCKFTAKAGTDENLLLFRLIYESPHDETALALFNPLDILATASCSDIILIDTEIPSESHRLTVVGCEKTFVPVSANPPYEWYKIEYVETTFTQLDIIIPGFSFPNPLPTYSIHVHFWNDGNHIGGAVCTEDPIYPLYLTRKL